MRPLELQLKPFKESDFPELASQIANTEFLMQWAGPKYVFPLSIDQINLAIDVIENGRRKNLIFTAYLDEVQVGHAQITVSDFPGGVANIGSILVYSGFRGKGFGKIIVEKTVREVFESLEMNEVRLGVFDFNKAALKCYESIGFQEYGFEIGARQVGGENWNLIRMRLSKSQFLI